MPAHRVGILGCGGMAKSHARAIATVDELEIVALCDKRAEALTGFLELAPAAKTYTDARVMLAEAGLDLLTIVTTGPSHAPLTVLAAETGVPRIFCEKPMATTLRDARRMIDVCAAHGARLAINHTRRWSPAHRRLAEALAGGILGSVRTLLCTLGAGRLGCNATHIIDLCRMLTGQDVADVTGWLDPTGTPDPRGPEFYDPGGHALLHLADGARIYLDQMEDLGVPPSLSLIGSLGQGRIEDLRGEWDLRARREADRDKPLLAYGCPLEPQPFDVSDCPAIGHWESVQAAGYRELFGDGPIACSGEDGYRAVEAVMAIHLSHARDHRPVQLPLAGQDLDFRVDFT